MRTVLISKNEPGLAAPSITQRLILPLLLALALLAGMAQFHSAQAAEVPNKQVLASEMVNINQADADELAELLEGVGPKKAEAIVAYRDSHGPFKSVEDLAKVKGIGAAILARNQDRIRL